jgi:regulatory protein
VKKETLSPGNALSKAMKYCALQERSHKEVREKLLSWGLQNEAAEWVIGELIGGNFLNEERFARAYARGKFNLLGWGKTKIRNGLYLHRISEKCTEMGLSEISEKDYRKALHKQAEKKFQSLSGDDKRKKWKKVMAYLVSKGFETELVYELMREEW